MKVILRFLVVALPSLCLGWLVGYIRLPMVEKEDGFWVGMIGGAAIVLMIMGLWHVAFSGKSETNGKRPLRVLWILAAFLVAAGGTTVAFWQQERIRESEWVLAKRDSSIAHQSALIGELRGSQNGQMLRNILDLADRDLQGLNGHLSSSTLARISAFSQGLKPYRPVLGDSLGSRYISPERGQLLMALLAMPLDSASWAEVKAGTSFAYAELKGANLAGKNLSGINLHAANLWNAELRGVDLSGSRMRFANLHGAVLDSADMSGADLLQADLRWVQANSAIAMMTMLNGADLGNGNFTGGDFRNAKLRFVNAKVAQFRGADLQGADLKCSKFSGANLLGAAVGGANLKMVDFQFARFEPENLDSVRIGQETWEKVLKEWHQQGASKDWAKDYVILKDTTGKFEAEFILLPR